jgi:integral membrane sensor domain MASE1
MSNPETRRKAEGVLMNVSPVWKAAVLCLLCYLGGKFSVWVKFHVGSAVFFPPYAFLTAALLMSPRRHWWTYLVAAFVGHFAARWPTWPLTWVALSGLANLSKALIAAIGIGYCAHGSLQLGTLRGVVIFVLMACSPGAGSGCIHWRGECCPSQRGH